MLNLEDLLKCFDNVLNKRNIYLNPQKNCKKHDFTKFYFIKNDFDLISLNTCADAIYIYYLQW